ncbi:MAG: hypothetical protein HY716_16250 [Planctomycetes bacterium]|nr:hypothetical protein [Planctomycetota bacterium]
MLKALLFIARWIGLAHDRWRARVCRRRPLAAEIEALRGMGGDMGGASIEPKVLHASAAELEAVARGLDAVRGRLGQTCKLLDVAESLRTRGK